MKEQVLKLVKQIYRDFDWDLHCDLVNKSFLRVLIFANDNMLQVLDEPYLRYLQANLLIHFFIVDPNSPLYEEFNISKQDFLVTSVSSAGASTSINSIRALDDGDFFTLDLYRTRYGREAYQIMSNLSGVGLV